ncbi:MAG TPA: hypothetical protein VK442_01955 [Xanthobacteraceae bacterium]|nr:hypothetical protein [Xanthobacteraceae bacterium]
MKKIMTALIAAAAIGAMAVATSSTAEARYWGHGGWGWGHGGWGWGWGGFAAGAIVGSALAAPYYYGYYYPYGYPYGYGYYPYGPYAYGPGCHRVWNGYAWVRACY